MTDRSNPPQVAHFSDFRLQPEKIIELSSGIDLHIVDFGTQPAVRIALIWDGGALDFPSKAAAQIMAATIPEGSEYMSAAEVADFFDFHGASIAGSLTAHHRRLEVVGIASGFEKALDVIAELAVCPSFPAQSVESAARRLAANRALMLKRVAFVASRRLDSLLFGREHPASHITTPLEFEAVDRDIVVLAYEATRNTKLHIYIAGMPDERLLNRLSDTFAAIAQGTASPIAVEPYRPEPPQRVHIAKDDARQSAIAIGLPAIGRSHPDYINLRLAVIALGGYFGSRLMSNIREEKGLTYGIRAALCGAHEGAYMSIEAQAAKEYTAQVVDETIAEIRRLATDPPAGDELNRLRLNAWTALAREADSPFSTLDHYINRRIIGIDDNYFARQLRAIADLDSDTIARMAQLYLNPDRLTIVTAGQ